jgi:hypothetical protein
MSKKGLFYILSIVLPLLLLVTFFLPVYQVPYGSGDTLTYGLGSFLSYWVSGEILAKIGVLLGIAVLLTAEVFLFLALLHLNDTKTDKVDRYYVYGEFIVALGAVVLVISDIGASSFLAMAIALVYVLFPFLFIFLHYKFLTDY